MLGQYVGSKIPTNLLGQQIVGNLLYVVLCWVCPNCCMLYVVVGFLKTLISRSKASTDINLINVKTGEFMCIGK